MSVNGITNTQGAAYSSYTTAAKTTAAKEQAAPKTDDRGVVYEPSSQKAAAGNKTYKRNDAVVAQLKADAQARTQQMEDLVRKVISQQGSSYGQANDIWKLLAGGNLKVDAATKAQAQKDIAEDGYWGVDQTSSRIVDFAKALTGGDPGKIDEMRKAFEKGFKMATKAWGQSLPSISNSTYDAVMKKFDAWENEGNTNATDNMNNNPVA